MPVTPLTRQNATPQLGVATDVSFPNRTQASPGESVDVEVQIITTAEGDEQCDLRLSDDTGVRTETLTLDGPVTTRTITLTVPDVDEWTVCALVTNCEQV